MQYRAFLAHKRTTEDKKIDQLVAGATLLLRDKGVDFAQVIAGRARRRQSGLFLAQGGTSVGD